MLSSSERLEGLQAEKVRFGIEAGEVGERRETAQDWVSLSVAFPCGRFVSKGSCDVEEERTVEVVGHGAVHEGKARVSRENGMDHGMDTANAKCGRRPRVAAAWGLLWRNRHAPPKQLSVAEAGLTVAERQAGQAKLQRVHRPAFVEMHLGSMAYDHCLMLHGLLSGKENLEKSLDSCSWQKSGFLE